jgi:hypothetical protein
VERVLRLLLEQLQMFEEQLLKGDVKDYPDYREAVGTVKGLSRAVLEIQEAIQKEKQREEDE